MWLHICPLHSAPTNSVKSDFGGGSGVVTVAEPQEGHAPSVFPVALQSV